MNNQVIEDDAREVLRGMAAESVHCAITSPPYFHLRAYAAPDLMWPDGWRGQLGAEPQIDLYVAHLVEVFREVRRVLRKDGVLFLNLGDSYGAGGGKQVLQTKNASHGLEGTRQKTPGIGSKQLCEIPSRVALALQADGWWLRSRIPWLKQNCMPESTTDRPTNAIEYWFMLTKAARYYWDPEAVRVGFADERMGNPGGGSRSYGIGSRNDATDSRLLDWTKGAETGGRNRRNSDWLMESFQGLILDELGDPLVMLVNPQGYDAEFCRACQRYYDGPDKGLVRIEKYRDERGEKKERRWCLCGRSDGWLSHYATFPEKAIEPIILAATSERGACPKCGASWGRIVKRGPAHGRTPGDGQGYRQLKADLAPHVRGEQMTANRQHEITTVGWHPTCVHEVADPISCAVLDPFSGTGTVGVVAERLGRRAVLIEVSPDYIAMSKARLEAARREPVVECDPALPLFADTEATLAADRQKQEAGCD